MKIGTKLAIFLSLIIILVLSGYGYFHIVSRRDILVRKMEAEVRSIGRTLKVSLEKISIPMEMDYVQEMIDTVEEEEKTLGVIVYHQGKDLILKSRSIKDGIEPNLEMIQRAVQEDRPREEFGFRNKVPVFSYSFPFKDKRGRNLGGVSILQDTSFMEKEIQRAKWSIFAIIFLLIGGTVALILFVMRKWVTLPVSQLTGGIQHMSKGELDTRINLKGKTEFSELAQAFNQMAVDLKEAQQRIIKEAETKLELERSLRQSEKLATIGQLASGLAHEIGTPLNIIGGRAELVKRKLDDRETAQKNLDTIVKQTERITKILHQLLGFVRKKKPEQKILNLNALLETTLEFLDHQFQKQYVRVVKEMRESLPPVLGDSDQLQQVFLNLFLNANQAMPGGGTLRLSASSKRVSKEGFEGTEREYVEVCVGDTGVGIEKEALPNIFNPFFTTKDRGTGLGLMVSQGIVQDHEGWIEVESERGKGSVFKLYLPVFEEVVKGGG